MRIAYFVHELADAAVHKRVRMLEVAGEKVTLLGFERDRGGGAPASPSGSIVLGRTQNGRFMVRALSIIGALPRAIRNRNEWGQAHLIMARNLEMLTLVQLLRVLTGSRASVAYECLDIHRLALSQGAIGAILRFVERLCLRGASMIITSSPAFERHYFRERQGFAGRIVLAENKMLCDGGAEMPQRPHGPPWIIAWCGVLRCKRSFDLLSRLARERPVRVELWGRPALDQIPDFHARVAETPGMAFHGPYTPSDLPLIYGAAHFSWAIDYYEEGANSDWLLPNRLYESLCYAAVPLAVAGVETARWLEQRAVGVVLGAPLDASLFGFFEQLTPSDYRRRQETTLNLAPEVIRFTPESCRAFAAQLGGALA